MDLEKSHCRKNIKLFSKHLDEILDAKLEIKFRISVGMSRHDV